jgi:hypothetical protein
VAAAAAAVATPRALAEESMAYLLGPGLNLLADMLPEQDLERLLVLRDEVEDTHREATAADAAVAAVAKVRMHLVSNGRKGHINSVYCLSNFVSSHRCLQQEVSHTRAWDVRVCA